MADLIKLKPLFHNKIWGGRRLASEYGYQIPDGPVGECWAISAHPAGDCPVTAGPGAGGTLSELWDARPELFGGEAGKPGSAVQHDMRYGGTSVCATVVCHHGIHRVGEIAIFFVEQHIIIYHPVVLGRGFFPFKVDARILIRLQHDHFIGFRDVKRGNRTYIDFFKFLVLATRDYEADNEEKQYCFGK